MRFKRCTFAGQRVNPQHALNYQQPCYKVIADFRKDNAGALRGVFRQLNQLCLDMNLFGRELVAIDGSKFRAQNSKKNNYNAAKVERHIKYIDKKLEEYFEAADKLDEEEQGEEQAEAWEALSGRVEELLERRGKYEDLEKRLEQSEERQISTTDKDARALPLHMGIVEVGYNIQTATDDKHCLIADYEVTNEKDDYALAKMGRRAKSALSVKELEVLADKGYHTGEELKNCSEEGITTYVLLHAAEGQKEGVRGVRADLHELCRRHAMWHNLRRVLSIVGVNALLERLKSLFFGISRLSAWRVGLSAAGSGRWHGALWAGRAA